MPDPFIGEVRIFAGNFAPTGWALCDGQLLSIASNTALFSLLGTTYGGNGVNTFGLPDLRGRVPIQPGQGPGLSLHDLGERAGVESLTLLATEMPQHTHAVSASNANGNSDAAAGRFAARSASAVQQYSTNADAIDTTLSAAAVGSSGGSQPHNNMQPYLVLNFIIALQGIYPPRP